jgi:hypothetical protein
MVTVRSDHPIDGKMTNGVVRGAKKATTSTNLVANTD